MAYIAEAGNQKGFRNQTMEELQRQMEIIEKQMAEQTVLRHQLERLTSQESARPQKTVDKAYTRNFKLKQEMDTNYGIDQKNPQQTSSKTLEEIMAKRTKEFQRSQAEKAANNEYLTQQREQIMKARNQLREKYDVFHSLPLNVGTEVIMKPSNRLINNNTRNVHSPQSYVHKLVTDIPDAVGRIWTLRESLHQDYLLKRKPYEGELGIESYKPWQIPDFLMVRRLVEEFVDNFIVKYIPPDYVIDDRDKKVKRLNQKGKDWSHTSKALSEKSAVKLVAEEIFLEVTASMIRDLASVGMHQDAMFRRMSGNMFMKEAEIQGTGNPKGRDPSDPAYDLITHFFSTLQKSRDHSKKGVWTHSLTFTHPAVPPPLPLVRKPLSGPEKLQNQKKSQKPDQNMDKKQVQKIETDPKGGNF